jgi:hypothetical protein
MLFAVENVELTKELKVGDNPLRKDILDFTESGTILPPVKINSSAPETTNG